MNCNYFNVEKVYNEPYFEKPLYFLINKFLKAELIYISPDEYLKRISEEMNSSVDEITSEKYINRKNIKSQKYI